MSRSKKAIASFTMLSFFVAALISVILFFSFQKPFYRYEYNKGNQAELIGMSDEDLMNATETLLDYLNNQRDDIIVEATVSGYEREVFNEREALHMVDVKNLVLQVKTVRWILLGGTVIGLIVLYLMDRRMDYKVLLEGCKNAFIILGSFIVCIGIWAIVDFYNFWMDFHYLFFANDLFLLDPNTSIMINMFPESFFFDLVILIAAADLLISTLIYFVLKKGSQKYA